MSSSNYINIKGLSPSWRRALSSPFQQQHMIELSTFLDSEIKAGKTIFPHSDDVFSAFHLTPLSSTRVVIIGQDPYHGEGQAHGLCFSVKKGIRPPPSLVNIFKELKSDLGIDIPNHGYLENWASQGILMINNVLTVEKSSPTSHKKKGWELFTDSVIEILNSKKSNLVFLLWGSDAREKCKKVDRSKHLVLESPHPSPFSAYKGFLGNRHFSKTNMYLKQNGQKVINWSLLD